MAKPEFTERQIAVVLRKVAEGAAVEDVCRMSGISAKTYNEWRAKYGVLMPSELKRLKQLEEENQVLKKLVAELSLTKELLQQVVQSKAHGQC